MSEGADDFAAAVENLLDHLDGRAKFDDQDWQVVLSALTRVVRSGRYPYSRDEAVEIATTAVTNFLAAARAGKIDRTRGGAGYLVQITRNEAASVSRRRDSEPVLEALTEEVEIEASDTSIDDLVNALGDKSRVRELFRVVITADCHDLASFIRVFLDLADEGRPTLRQLGEALDLSPSTISSRIDDLQAHIAGL
jgi:hypothetical protein